MRCEFNLQSYSRSYSNFALQMKDKTNSFDLSPFVTQSLDYYSQDNWIHLYARPMLIISLELFQPSLNEDTPSLIIAINAVIKTLPKEPKIKLEECLITPSTIVERHLEYAMKYTELALKYDQTDGSIGRFQIKFTQQYEANLVNERLKTLFLAGKKPTTMALTPQSQTFNQIGSFWSTYNSQDRGYLASEVNLAVRNLTEDFKSKPNCGSFHPPISYESPNCTSMKRETDENCKMNTPHAFLAESSSENTSVCNFCLNFAHLKRNCIEFSNFSYINCSKLDTTSPCFCKHHAIQGNTSPPSITELYTEWIAYAKLIKQAQALDCNHKLLLKTFLK